MIRNTFVPVNGLPPEILLRILECRTRESDLVAATQVCRYWRSTLTSSPSLWSCFQFQSSHDLDRTLTYLKRSKSAPIDVSINTGLTENLDVLEYLAPRIARTRSLVIQAYHDIHTASLLFCNPAPLLQHLEILSTSEGVVHLPDNFLGQQAPSLRSVSLVRICPTLESLFPLPNLTEFHLSLVDDTAPFRVGALFQFLSESPLLQKIGVDVHDRSVQDVFLNEVISLESLVELDCDCDCASQIIPFLRLPRLKRLRVTSREQGRAQTLADVLPYGGRPLLAGVTKILYRSGAPYSVELSGNGVDVSFRVPPPTETTLLDWSPDQTWIPFGQIEDLEFRGLSPTRIGLHINAFALENLRVLRVVLFNEERTKGLLRAFHPGPGTAEVPCRSLQEIEVYNTYWGSQEPLPRLLVSIVRERKQASCQLRLVSLVVGYEGYHRDFLLELKEHVGEVRAREHEPGNGGV